MNPGQCNGNPPDAGATSAPESDLVEVAIEPMLVRGTWQSALRGLGLALVAIPIIGVVVAVGGVSLINAVEAAGRAGYPAEVFVPTLIIGGGLATAMTYLLVRDAGRRRFRRHLRESAQVSLVDRVSEALRDVVKHRWFEGDAARAFDILHYLLEQHWAGCALRVCPAGARPPADPIDVPFEPLPLSECTPAVRELLRLGPPDDQARRACAEQQEQRRRTARLGLTVVVVGALLSFVLWYLWRRAWRGPSALIWLLVLGVVALERVPFAPNAQWLIVPGGVILRKSGLFRQRWDVHLFDRRRAVLTVCQIQRTVWWFAVADDQQHAKGRISAKECEALLRAWRSPLTPPSIELLSELH